MNYVKHRAITFRNKTKLANKSLFISDLSLAANKMGYIVKPYSTCAAMMIALGVYEEAMSSASVSVKDNTSNVVIFINDRLNIDKQLFALAHEIGHIYLGHNCAIPKSQQEEEANEFANYLLNNKPSFPFSVGVSLFLSVALFLALLAIIIPLQSSNPKTTQSVEAYTNADIYIETPTTYYWTEAGYVYHCYRDCQSLKHSENIISGNLSQASKEKRRLCKFCESKLK